MEIGLATVDQPYRQVVGADEKSKTTDPRPVYTTLDYDTPIPRRRRTFDEKMNIGCLAFLGLVVLSLLLALLWLIFTFT
jgi:hypothetical protein